MPIQNAPRNADASRTQRERDASAIDTRDYSRCLCFVLATCIPMFVAIALAKCILYEPLTTVGLTFPLKLALIVSNDLLFVLAWGLIGLLALLATRRWKTVHWLTCGVLLCASVLSTVFGVAFIWIYGTLRMPLTLPLLRLSGGVRMIRSSLNAYLTPICLASLLAAVLLYLASVYALVRVRWRLNRRRLITVSAVLIAWFACQQIAYSRWIAGGPKEGLAESPHWALIESCLLYWRGEAEISDTAPVSPAYSQDFHTGVARADPPAHDIARGQIRNVIVVVLESTGTQFLGVYGSRYRTTPCLDAESDNAFCFDNFSCNAGYTLQSMLPLVLSIYPGTGWTIYSSDFPHLSGTSTAQVLHERGWRTAFMTSQALQYRSIYRFFDNRGFDQVVGAEQFLQRGQGKSLSSWGIDDPTLFDALLRWIAEAQSKPFYVMIWTQQTHHPYQLAPEQPLLNLTDVSTAHRPDLNRYLNAIHLADAQLGRLFVFLRERNLADSTLVIITGDHGEAFGFPHRWMFHGTSLYQEAVRVPLILWNPRLFHPGRHMTQVGGHIDLNPTILDLLDIPAPVAWQGESLFDPARVNRSYFSCNTGNLLLGLRDGNDKYIYNATLGREELYDLAADPQEQTNIAAARSDECHTERQRLTAWRRIQGQMLSSLSATPDRP